MTTIGMIANAIRLDISGKYTIPELPCEPATAICAVTGVETECLPRNKIIGSSFTDNQMLVAPNSKFISVDTFIAWFFGYYGKEGSKRLKCPERMSSWLVTKNQDANNPPYFDGFYELDRQGVRDFVINYLVKGYMIDDEIWSIYVTTSYKKHGSLYTKVNTGNKAIVRFEMLDVDCSDREKLMEIWNRLNIEIRKGFGRSILETLECPISVINKIGLEDWVYFEQWAKPLFRSPLYKFMCYLLPSQAELKEEKALEIPSEPKKVDNEPLKLFL